jgi:hypothetical protein
VQISEFEQSVWRIDRLRLFVRAPKEATVQDYDWKNAADQGMTLTEYRKLGLLRESENTSLLSSTAPARFPREIRRLEI